MLDVVYIGVMIALFAVVTLVVKGAERLVPPVRRSAVRDEVRAEVPAEEPR